MPKINGLIESRHGDSHRLHAVGSAVVGSMSCREATFRTLSSEPCGMRIAIYGFHQDTLIAALDSLHQSQAWQIVYWVGANLPHRRFDDDIIQWHLGNLEWEPLPNADDPLLTVVDRFIAQLEPTRWEQFQDQLSRHPCGADLLKADVSQFLRRLLLMFVGQLHNRAAQALLMQNLPHQGFDLALYWAAKILKLPTTLCYQTVLPNRFFFCHDLDDFGWFRQVESRTTVPPPPLPEGFDQPWFYMQNLPADQWLHNPDQWSAAKLKWRDLKLRWKAWKQQVGWYRWIGKSHGFNVEPAEHYHWNLRRHSVDWQRWADRNPDSPFVYFPLHLQPELTSSTLGDQYRDQLKALEALSAWLPQGASLVVKENPKQTYRYRDQAFFDRLQNIPKVVFIGKIGNTYEIMRRARFVATLSGTVGWEAINGGKNTLVFGRPWYLSLPGVYYWPQRPTWNQLAETPIDRLALDQAFQKRWDFGRPGIVDLNYAAATPEFNEDGNRQSLTDFFREQIRFFSASQPSNYIMEK